MNVIDTHNTTNQNIRNTAVLIYRRCRAIFVSSSFLFFFFSQDGIDYAATTIQSNYERIPFLFTVKDLVAKASSGGNQVKPGFQMGGGFRTPSYRTGLFLDPKGRGGSTGYDMAVALPGLQSGVEGDAEMFKENNKVFDVTDGNIEFEVNNVDKEAGEIGGALCACLCLPCARARSSSVLVWRRCWCWWCERTTGYCRLYSVSVGWFTCTLLCVHLLLVDIASP